QRSPLITQNPIAYYPHQIAIARQQKQTRLPNSPKLNSDRPSSPQKTITYSQNQTAIAPHHTQNPIAFSSNKTAIAHHQLIAYFSHQTAI
ncbi:MAG TPA: hypothetical protein DCZ88_11970, partial [Pseudanabaena sp.]|nr:hypothetical protein [Pseudanabaena sp.]